MTARQKSKLAMYEVVLAVCERNGHVWRELPAFASAYERFVARVDAIRALTKVQKRHTGGVAEQKLQLREAMCAIAHEIACAARACALSAGRLDLAGRLDFSLTDLRVGRDLVCVERCKAVHGAAAAQVSDLQAFGVTLERLASLEQIIGDFGAILGKPREIRAANKEITARLPIEFDLADDLLNNHLDNLVPQFRNAYPRFFAAFSESRVMNGAPDETGQSIQSEETHLD